MDEPISFGYWVRRRRKALDLTSEELARQVGCAGVTIRKIELDERRPSRQIAERLAVCLGIPEADRSAFLKAARAELAVDRLATPPEPPLTPPAARQWGDRTPRQQALKGYELREQIGAGGFGAVYRAVQPGIGREVAVKIILPEHADHPEFIRRFEAEAQLVVRLEHPHIVPLYDYWRESGGAYLVMRYIRGGSLQSVFSGGAWELERCTRLIDQIGGALAFAHRHGVVHRDIKPANILLDTDGNAYLADFGIAKDLGAADAHDPTQAGAIVGSPAYLSPEQIRDEPVTQQTDMYSLGIVLYELLTGAHPFAELSPAERLAKQLNESLPALGATRSDLPDGLDTVIQRATAKRPVDRYPDILAMLADWQRISASGQAASVSASLAPTSAAIAPIAADEAAGERTLTDVTQIDNPYKGLRAFAEADAADFFGREALTERLLERLAEVTPLTPQPPLPAAGEGEPAPMRGEANLPFPPAWGKGPGDGGQRFLAVVGPSGSGKSSVVRAGLIPALRRGGLPGSEDWFVVEVTPGAHPMEELEAALLRVAVNPPPSLLEQLQADERGLLRAIKRVLPADEAVELVLVIDQFEEVFTLVEDEAARAHFLNSLVAAVSDARSRVWVIVTLRADFYDRPLRYGGLGGLVRSRTEVVLPLTPAEQEHAIVGPAERAGLRLEFGLVTAIVKDVSEQPGTLPLLQYGLTELFERREGLTLSLKAYQASGGVLGALSRRADALYDGLGEAGQEAARQFFLRLVTLGEGVEDTRRRVRRSELESVVSSRLSVASAEGQPTTDYGPLTTGKVLDLYGRYRLLTFDRDPLSRAPTVEIAHEALIRTWGRLRGWLDESRHALRVQRRLAAAADEWKRAGHDPSFQASGARLAQFEALVETSELMLNAEETAYLEASVAERDRQRLAERERQTRELELARQSATAQRSAASRLRYFVGALAVFLIVAIGLAAFAFNQQAVANSNAAQAQANLTRSEAQRLAAEANRLIQVRGNSQLIALLSIKSMRLQYTTQGNEALTGAARLDYPTRQLKGHLGYVVKAVFSPDDRYVLTGGADRVARLWDAQTGNQIQAFSHPNSVESLAFSPDNAYVLTGDGDGILRLWNPRTGQQLRMFKGHDGPVLAVAFAPNGRSLLSTGMDKTVRLWDLQTGQQIRRLTGHSDAVYSGAFSPDGGLVVTSSADKTARLWNVSSGEIIREFQGHTNWVLDAAFTNDGKYVVTGSADGTARLWDVQTGKELRRYTGHTSGIQGISVSHDDHLLLTVGNDRSARLWDIRTGAELRRFIGQTSEVKSGGLSRDGRLAVTGSLDGTVLLWDTQAAAILPIMIHMKDVNGVAYSPDGRVILSGSSDGTARLWDARTGAELLKLTGQEGVNRVAFSPDGRYLLTGGNDKTARLWDASTGQEARRFVGHQTEVLGVAISPDGRYVLTSGSGEGEARLWDVRTGKELRQFVGHTFLGIWYVAFSPDSRFALTGSYDKTARLWDVATGSEVLRFTIPNDQDGVVGLAFSPDGKYILTGNFDGNARMWSAETGQQVRMFTGHSGVVGAVAFSPDGRSILTGGEDGTARLWDAQTGQEIERFAGHFGDVFSVAFSPDGKRVLTGGADGTVRIWDADYHDTIKSLCSRLLRDFSDDERAQYGISNDGPTCPKP